MKTASLLLILLCISSLPVFSQSKYETEPVSSAIQDKLDQVTGKVVYSCRMSWCLCSLLLGIIGATTGLIAIFRK